MRKSQFLKFEIDVLERVETCRFRVWDYPVREVNRHLSRKINESIPVTTPEEGYRRVHDAVDGKFAFLYSSREV